MIFISIFRDFLSHFFKKNTLVLFVIIINISLKFNHFLVMIFNTFSMRFKTHCVKIYLDLSKLLQYFYQFKPVHLKNNEIILRPDFTCRNVFFIESGFVKLYSILENGEERIISFCKSHDFFPLVEIFRGSVKNFFAETLSLTTIRYVDENHFQEFLKNDSEASMELINYFSDRLGFCLERIENLGFIQASQKIIFGLLFLIKRFGVADGNDFKLQLPVTQKEIASALAMTRETVSREFEKLEKENILDLKNHEIVIKNIRYLIEKANNFCEYDWQLL